MHQVEDKQKDIDHVWCLIQRVHIVNIGVLEEFKSDICWVEFKDARVVLTILVDYYFVEVLDWTNDWLEIFGTFLFLNAEAHDIVLQLGEHPKDLKGGIYCIIKLTTFLDDEFVCMIWSFHQVLCVDVIGIYVRSVNYIDSLPEYALSGGNICPSCKNPHCKVALRMPPALLVLMDTELGKWLVFATAVFASFTYPLLHLQLMNINFYQYSISKFN